MAILPPDCALGHRIVIDDCGDVLAEIWTIKWKGKRWSNNMEQQDLPNVFTTQSLEERLPKVRGVEQWITNCTDAKAGDTLHSYRKMCPNHVFSVGVPNENTYAMLRAGQSIKNTGRPLSSLGIVGIYARLRDENNG